MFVLLSTSYLVTVAQHYTLPLLCTCTSQIHDPSVLITGKTNWLSSHDKKKVESLNHINIIWVPFIILWYRTWNLHNVLTYFAISLMISETYE